MTRCNSKCAMLLLATVAVECLTVGPLNGQIIEQRIIIRNQGVIQFGAVEFGPFGSSGQPVPDAGASLKTDPELEAILEKAERFREEQQFGIASKLWQSVLERSGDALYSPDDKVFYSLTQRVEQILAELSPDDGLATYRITADADAKELMAQANGPFDEIALQQVVRRFFLSSLGDDAALTLSSIYMDQHDFVGAYRMLSKIVSSYPDPSVSLAEVYAAMALCQAMIGEEKTARQTIGTARTLVDAPSSNSKLDAVEEVVNSGIDALPGGREKAGFVSALANRNRRGLMPDLPDDALEYDLEATWQYYYAPETQRWVDIKRIKPITGNNALADAAETVSNRERAMIVKWRQQHWRPTGNLLFDAGRVYFKTSVDLTVWDDDANSEEVVWRPLWRNEFEPDDFTQGVLDFQRRMQRGRNVPQSASNQPDQPHEIQLFRDGVASQMSIQDSVLYTIEGSRFDTIPVGTGSRNNLRFNPYSRRSRSNHLTAYDAPTGRLLWTLPPTDAEEVAEDAAQPESPWLQSGGFMAAPIHYAGLAIVPVNHGGAISVYALDPQQNGKTVWKAYLCDESATGANPWSPVNLSIDGSDLFASCGLGVVFIINPATGLIRFAKRYERDGQMQNSPGRFGIAVQQINYESWSSDTIVAWGRQMICFSSDAKKIEAHDRNTSELIWWCDIDPLEAKVDYLLGVHGGKLYAAGSETILAFDLEQEGRMVWGGKALFDGEISFGRGMLTSDGIYMPVENSIRKYSLAGKDGRAELLETARVDLGTGAPVGNLFSDGRKIWVQGANRIYALGPAQ